MVGLKLTSCKPSREVALEMATYARNNQNEAGRSTISRKGAASP